MKVLKVAGYANCGFVCTDGYLPDSQKRCNVRYLLGLGEECVGAFSTKCPLIEFGGVAVVASNSAKAAAPGACCAHLKVSYKPVDCGDGSCAPEWRCDTCGLEFAPVLRVMENGDKEKGSNFSAAARIEALVTKRAVWKLKASIALSDYRGATDDAGRKLALLQIDDAYEGMTQIAEEMEKL